MAGALAERLDEREDTVFFVDIGTNGEMILCRDHKLVSCSCAAGPALEGMNIGCGMRAAQGAILSGCQCLLDELKLRLEEIDHVLVAGQFGRHLSPESLVGAGLLPPAFASKISYVGNSSRAGATMCLLSQAERQRAQRMARAISYVDLSTKSGYESSFLSCMSFDLRAD